MAKIANIKDNGEIVYPITKPEAVIDENGKTLNDTMKGWMPATPSGDPMHYLYVTAGAEYNDTGADITRTGVYGDTVTWKAGYWWLNELGDITNEEMREIYVYWHRTLSSNCYYMATIRTNLPFINENTNSSSDTRDRLAQIAYSAKFEVFDWRVSARNYTSQLYLNNCFTYCHSLRKILEEIDFAFAVEIGQHTFNCLNLEEVRFKNIKVNISFRSPKLSYGSIEYLIANSAATSAITLTLHATAFTNAETAYLADANQDLTTYPTLSDWALSKNIQIATA